MKNKLDEIAQIELAYRNEKELEKKIEALLTLANPQRNFKEENALAYSREGIEMAKEYADIVQFKVYEIYGLAGLSKVEEGLRKCDELLVFIRPDDKVNSLKVIDYILNLKLKQADYQGVISYGDKLPITDSLNEDESRFIAAINMNIGIAYASIGNVEDAVKYFLLTKDVYEKLDETIGVGQINYNIAALYLQYNEYDAALKYLDQSLKYLKITGNPKRLSMVYEAYARLYRGKNDRKQVKKYLQKAIQSAEDFPRRKNHILINYAIDLIEQNELKEFFEIENQILNSPSFLEMELRYATHFYNTASRAHILDNNIDKASFYVDKLKEIPKEKIDVETQLTILQTEQQLFEKTGDYEQALQTHKKYFDLFQEKLSDAKQKVINELEVKYETAQKEKEAEEYKTASLKFQLQSLRAQMNPHFVFNAISSIANDLKPDSTPKAKELLKSFARIMRANLDFADREMISLEEEIEFLKDYLNLEANRLKDQLNFTIEYDDNLSVDFIEVPSMLIQPFVENAVKHGIMPSTKKGLITIRFEEQDDVLICTIRDNGIGRKAAGLMKERQVKHLGKSTKITETRLSLLSQKDQSEIQVIYEDLYDQNQNAVGTKVQLSIQL